VRALDRFAALSRRASGWAVPEPESGLFLQQGYRQELSVDWPEAAKCPLVGLLDDLRQLRWHADLAAEVSDRCELLTAPVQPEGREVVPVEQRAEVVADERGGCRAGRQRLAEHVEVDSGAAASSSLAGSHGLAEPQQVNQDGTVIIRNTDGFDLALHPVGHVEPSPAFLHVGFKAGKPAEVRTLMERMEADGITVVERNDEAAYVAFKCLDPDGHRIEVYWEPPHSR